jgi:hypothetical protein
MRHHERVGVITGYMDLGEGTNHKRVEYMSRAYMNLSPGGNGRWRLPLRSRWPAGDPAQRLNRFCLRRPIRPQITQTTCIIRVLGLP